MAGLFDDLLPGAAPAGGGMFDDLVPKAQEKKPLPERSKLAAVNDTVIDAANAVAGGVGSVADFIAPGNPVSSFINENIIKPGQEKQSDRKKAINAQLAEDIKNADGLTGEAAAAVRYALADPAGVLAQAAGSFVVPGAAIKAGGMLARGAGAGATAASRAGMAGGAAAGAALSGGDAAGQAYEESKAAGATEEQAQDAARQASVIPAVIGGAGGMLGAERLLAGGRGFAGGAASRAIKTGLSEGVQEGLEEGVTQYEANRAVAPFDGRDPMKGVGSAATLGALMGAPIGGVTGALSSEAAPALAPAPAPVVDPVVPILNAGSMDEAIRAASDAVRGTPENFDTMAENAALESDIAMLDRAERQEALGLLATIDNPRSAPAVRRFAQNRLDQLLAPVRQVPAGEATEMLPTPDAAELTDEERAAYVSAPSFVDRYRMSRGIPAGEATEAIPTGDAAEVEPIPAGDASEEIPAPEAYEQVPAGEATEAIPTGDAMEVPRIPAGKATEIEPEVVEPTDLTTSDGMPYGSKTAANVRAKKEGLGPANVVEIPGAGWVVRPQPRTLGPAPISAQPAGTRGTTAADILKAPDAPNPARTAGPRPADGGRGDGAGVLPVVQPGDVAAGAAAPSGQGVDGGGAAGPGGRGGALSEPAKPRTLQDARVDAALDRQVRENGEFMTRRQWVERKVAEGLKTRITQEDRIKPMSRMAYFRATNEEQREHERKIKAGGKKDVYWIGDYEVTKIEHDYATRLTAEQAAPPPAKQGPTPQGATDEGLQRQGQGRREEVAAAPADAAAPAETAPAQARVPDAAAPAPTLADKIKQRRAEKAAEPAPPVATHKDPGEPAEPATAPVIAQALGKAARKEALSRAAMKAEALRLVDAAIAAAPKEGGKKITIKVPGDGTFTVVNNVARLREFRRQIELSPGFKEPRGKPPIAKANSSADYGPDQLAREMLEDGEPMNAVEALEAAGKTMMFGNGGDARPIPYTNGEPVEIEGIADLFVGRGWSTKKGSTSWWSVVHKPSGFALGTSGGTKAEAIAEAKKLLAQPEKRAKLAEIAATGKSADGKPFKTQDELRTEFMAWAEKHQQETLNEADALQARVKAMNEKEKERDAFYQSIMGADMRRPKREDWSPASVEELLNAAEKQGKADEALAFMRDVVSNYSEQAVDKWARAYERRTQPADTGWQTGFQAPGGYRRIRRDVTLPDGTTYRAELDERAGAYVTGMVQKWSTDNGTPKTVQTFSNDMDARRKADQFMDGLTAKPAPAAPAPAPQPEADAAPAAEPAEAERRRKAVSEADQKLAQTVAFYGLRGQDDFGKALLRALETSTTPRSLGRFATKGTVSEVQRRKAQTLADNGRLPVAPAVILDKQGVPLAGVYLQLPFADPRTDDFWNRRVLEDIGAVGDVVYPAGAWTSQPASTATEPASGKKSFTGSSPTASHATSTSVASTATDSGSQSQQNKLVVNYGGGKTKLDLERPAWQYSQAEMAKAIEDQWGGSGVADFFKEAHMEAIEVAARNGEPLPTKVLYDFPRYIRRDLNDLQADEATDAMVDEYRATKDYGKAVAVYRNWGKPAAETPAPVRDERTIELRKRASVLRSLRECLG